MKTSNTLKVLLTALLLGTGLSGAHAASLLADGDFDSLPVGTAPDVGTPAGYWFWQTDYPTVETDASQFSIVPAPGGGTGNCLLLSLTATEFPANRFDLPSLLGRSVTKASGEILHVSFDIYVAPGRGGGAVVLGKGMVAGQDRGPQLAWLSTGELITRSLSAGITTLIASYPRGVWQTVRLEVDLARDRFNFYWSEKGQPVSVIHSNLGLQSGTIPYIDRLNIVRFADDELRRNVHSYIDNIRVSAGEPAAVVPGQSYLLPGGSLTLGLTNTLDVPSTYQWQFNDAALPGATGPTLAVSNVTTNDSGSYRVTISNAFEVVTTSPALVQVVERGTITADTFGSGANSFTIDFVDISNPGNGDDLGEGGGSHSSPHGGVAYLYRMGVTEVPQEWITKATNLGMANVTAGAWTNSRPAANMTWYEAAAFVNWLNTSKGHQAAYDLTYSGGWSMNLWSSAQAWQAGGENLYRHKDAYYFLPSEDEWYKAAYHQNDGVTANYWDYATGSNEIPTAVASGTGAGTVVYNQSQAAAVDNNGGLSPYGTRGQNGNVVEMQESAFTAPNDSSSENRVRRGGPWALGADILLPERRATYDPSSASFDFIGFRVATVPQPAAALLRINGLTLSWERAAGWRLQVSEDLQNWSNIGDKITDETPPYIHTPGSPKAFFRLHKD